MDIIVSWAQFRRLQEFERGTDDWYGCLETLTGFNQVLLKGQSIKVTVDHADEEGEYFNKAIDQKTVFYS